MNNISDLMRPIPPLDLNARRLAAIRQQELTKPPGSLGRLEDLFIALAGMRGSESPTVSRKAVLVFAADHGVARRDISAYPQRVTAQMLSNFENRGAAINALSESACARLVVTDVGVINPPRSLDFVVSRSISSGTRDFSIGPAMSTSQALSAIRIGVETLKGAYAMGLDIVAIGDMGIGNTSSASAITSVICRRSLEEVTGPGTGLDYAGLRRKRRIIAQALARNVPDPEKPLDVLKKVGGFEIGALAGVIMAAAQSRVPVILDGFITGAAALIAFKLNQNVRDYLIAAHRSSEPGHTFQLKYLRLKPLVELNLRLGEGTGAALAFPIIEAACAVGNSMKTFSEAGVSDKSGEKDDSYRDEGECQHSEDAISLGGIEDGRKTERVA